MKLDDLKNYKLTQDAPCIWSGMNPDVEIPEFYNKDHRLSGTYEWMYRFVTWEKSFSLTIQRIFKLAMVVFTAAAIILSNNLLAKCTFFAICVGFGVLYQTSEKNVDYYLFSKEQRLRIAKAISHYPKEIPTKNLGFAVQGGIPGQHNGVPEYLRDSRFGEHFATLKSPIYQGIDSQGRAFVAFQVKNKHRGVVRTGICHQRCHETNGDLWVEKNVIGVYDNKHDNLVTRLEKLVQGTDEEYELYLEA